MMMQERLIFQDEALPTDYQFEFPVPFEEINLKVGEARLNGLHFKTAAPKGLIIYYHGNSGNLSRWGKEVQFFVKLNYDVVVMDYRGYGKSVGNRSMKILLDDAQLFYDYGKEYYPEDKITLYGRSLGTGIVTHVASNNKPKQLILETPYYDFKSIVQRFYPIFPVGLSLKYNFKTNVYIQNVQCPIYIFHGTSDDIVPYESGKKLHESVTNGNSELITIQNGEHKGLIEFDQVRDKMVDILN
jgi:uncharacterized protein